MSISVAFQGIKGANSDLAIRQHFGEDVNAIPCPDLNVLFHTLQNGEVDYALLPVENALAGAVNKAYELLMDHDFRIQAEVILHVHHALLAQKGSVITNIQYVRSHPQALAQCEQFLKRHQMEAIPWYDTAGAALDLSKEQYPNSGAIATELAAELYNLQVMETQVEDVPFNYTRFFVLGNEDPEKGEYNKTSIVFATRNRPSALYKCLGEFAKYDINLTKIESRPRRNRPWEPVFFLDFEGHWLDDHCQKALTSLLQQASFVKMLGSYPAVKNGSVGI